MISKRLTVSSIEQLSDCSCEKAYLSLRAFPLAPFPTTEMIASSKFHPEAAEATPAAASRKVGSNENRILMLCVYVKLAIAVQLPDSKEHDSRTN